MTVYHGFKLKFFMVQLQSGYLKYVFDIDVEIYVLQSGFKLKFITLLWEGGNNIACEKSVMQ